MQAWLLLMAHVYRFVLDKDAIAISSGGVEYESNIDVPLVVRYKCFRW